MFLDVSIVKPLDIEVGIGPVGFFLIGFFTFIQKALRVSEVDEGFLPEDVTAAIKLIQIAEKEGKIDHETSCRLWKELITQVFQNVKSYNNNKPKTEIKDSET